MLAGEQIEMRNSKQSFVVFESIDKGQRVSGQMARRPLLQTRSIERSYMEASLVQIETAQLLHHTTCRSCQLVELRTTIPSVHWFRGLRTRAACSRIAVFIDLRGISETKSWHASYHNYTYLLISGHVSQRITAFGSDSSHLVARKVLRQYLARRSSL